MLNKPTRLFIGDTIGIIAPSIALKEEYFADSFKVFQSKGYNLKFGKNTFKNTYGYAASPQERADDFNDMIIDLEVKMILFGGGWVCNELLPLIDYNAITKHPKIICSYSDGTSILNAVTSMSKIPTYYGQSPRTFSNLTDYNYNCFTKAFMQTEKYKFNSNNNWNILYGGKGTGILIGGYLGNFALMINGKYLKYDEIEKYILFIEDHIKFSNIAAISRYFSHIEQSGFFANVSGLIFGNYSEPYEPAINEILERIGRRYEIPIVRCEDFGHGVNNAILPIGILAELDADNKSLDFSESLVNQIK